MGGAARVALPAAVVAGSLTGCAGSHASAAKPAATAGAAASAGASASTGAAAGVAQSGGRLGAAGSACALPVSFDFARNWKPKSIDAKPSTGGSGNELAGDPVDAPAHQGPVTAACEIDAKPAGNIGFIRVWTGKPDAGDPRTVLKAFVSAEGHTSKATYRAFSTGGLAGVEVDYLYTSKLLDETKRESALAVPTPHGPVVVHLGGLDTQEHQEMLPAYELAKRTLRVT
ncbi:lipoprotein [Streptomyces sp. NPDC006739]|uniref:lipoprotein n=1 Tax=Streptomyces sp. NPDC006739 TaxID=3364763 RepID=UPI0036B56390